MEEQKIWDQYWSQKWALDFDVYHAYSKLTDEELEKCTNKLREALTANSVNYQKPSDRVPKGFYFTITF